MTAINVFLRKEGAVALSDTLFIRSADSLPAGFHEKCVAVEGQRTAILARGDYRVPSGVALLVPRYYDSIDEIIDGEAARIAEAYEEWTDEAGVADGAVNAVEIFFLGWSDEADVPRMALLVRKNNEWSFEEIGRDGYSGPLLSDEELSRLALLGVEPGEDVDAEGFDPVKHGIPLLEAQRRMVLPVPHMKRRDKTHIVGGHVLLTEVTREGVRQEIIHHWPEDQVGVPVKPAPFFVPLRPGASRQERRAHERLMRKVAA